jgi:hypothetical protein
VPADDDTDDNPDDDPALLEDEDDDDKAFLVELQKLVERAEELSSAGCTGIWFVTVRGLGYTSRKFQT